MKRVSKYQQALEEQEAFAAKQQIRKELSTRVMLEHPHFTSSMMMCKTLKEKDFGGGVAGIDFTTADVSMKLLTEKVKDGDLAPIEEILFGQLKWLEQLVQVEHGMMSSQTQIPHHLSMGYFMLKVQEQARKTAATLASIKQGPRQTTFVKQQNQAVNQQVNNSEIISSNVTNEVLEVQHDVDGGTSKEAGSSHPALEAVAEEFRPEVGGRQSEISEKLNKVRVAVPRND